MEVNIADVVLCEFYFSDLKTSKKRPVLVFKDNLPYDDFVGIPISSQLRQLYADEGSGRRAYWGLSNSLRM